MTDKTQQLARHSQALVAQIAIQRADIMRQAVSLKGASHFIDKVRAGVLYLKHHREAYLLPLAVLLVSRPRRIVAFFVSSLGIWRLIQNFRRALGG